MGEFGKYLNAFLLLFLEGVTCMRNNWTPWFEFEHRILLLLPFLKLRWCLIFSTIWIHITATSTTRYDIKFLSEVVDKLQLGNQYLSIAIISWVWPWSMHNSMERFLKSGIRTFLISSWSSNIIRNEYWDKFMDWRGEETSHSMPNIISWLAMPNIFSLYEI